MSRTAAEGNLKKLIWFLIGAAACLFVASWYPQFSQGYEVENAGKLACNDAFRALRFGPDQAPDWKAKFIEKSTVAGVHLTEKNFTFDVKHERGDQKSVCKVRVHYPVDAEVAWVGPILGMQPIHFEKSISFTHEVTDFY